MPGWIAPHDSGMAYLAPGPVASADLTQPIVAYARLADGSRHQSPPTVVDLAKGPGG